MNESADAGDDPAPRPRGPLYLTHKGSPLDQLAERVAALEARLAEVPRYVGTFSFGRIYERGEMISHGGSIWHCERSTMERPSNGEAHSPDWRLAVKHGRNGKDGKCNCERR